jgi:kynurenine formamidase
MHRLRGAAFVEHAQPVHGWELEEALQSQGVKLGAGDALCVYSGREAWQAAHGREGKGYGTEGPHGDTPGLHASCLKFLRDHDVAVLVWDMMDYTPSGYNITVPVHGAIFAYGIAFVDNALLEPLSAACLAEGRWDFMFSIAPLKFVGGTGGPINPLAHF